MLCPNCYGKGAVLVNDNLEPCKECHGCGIIHCCEGLIEGLNDRGGPDLDDRDHRL